MTHSKNQKKEFHIDDIDSDKTALDYLAPAAGLSRQKIKTAMQQGCVWLEKLRTTVSVAPFDSSSVVVSDEPSGLSTDASTETSTRSSSQSSTKADTVLMKSSPVRLRRAKKVLSAGDVLHFYYDENILNQKPVAATLISDEGDYSIWNKPSGMFSQGSKWGDHCTIQRWVEKNIVPERVAFVVHRLDRAAQGLIIVAHKKKVATQFSQMFEARRIEKVYQVRVEGNFEDNAANTVTLDTELEGKRAVSHISLVTFDERMNQTLLNVNIETGRKHQIRKHLSGFGFPVVGDRLYGSGLDGSGLDGSGLDGSGLDGSGLDGSGLDGSGLDGSGLDEKDLQLSAVRLAFICPVSQQKKLFIL